MFTNLRWEKGVFSKTYRIYSNNQQIGSLVDEAFSQSSSGELDGRGYTFRTKGIFNQRTEILDNNENKVIGEVTYNSWMTKATLSVLGKRINWKYDNIWNSKWSIFDKDGIKIKYSGSSKNGIIESTTDDALLLLFGLFVTNYYRQMFIVIIVAVFIPIWVSVLQ